jgi:superfamily II DNA/RNA helicase
MLDMGFIPDVERIVGLLPGPRQTLFFSATMPVEIRKLADAFLREPVEIAVAPPASPSATVVQSLAVVRPEDKREALRRLIRSEDVKNALIFCNRKRDVDILFRSLSRHGLDAAALHGDMPQPKRTETLERFRNGEIRLLVASDVAARGLDIQGLSHVFCFDVPTHAEDYIHRIGRTARAGRLGRSFMLATPEDGRAVAAIVKLIGKEIPFSVIPGIEEVELDYDERRRRGARRDTRPARQPARTGDAGRRSTPTGQDRRARVTNAAPPDMAGSNVTPFPGAAGVHRSGQQERKAREAPKVVGFGDHLPAFLSRAPRIVARP